MSVKDILKEYIIRELMYEASEVTLDEDVNLVSSGLIDSLNILQLVHFVENRFNIPIPQTSVTVTKFSSIRAIANYVAERRREISGGSYA